MSTIQRIDRLTSNPAFSTRKLKLGTFQTNLDSGCVDALPDGKLAAFGTTEGELYSTADEGGSWTRITAGLGGIAAVRVLP